MVQLADLAGKFHHYGWNGVDALPSPYTVNRVRSSFSSYPNVLDEYFYVKVRTTTDLIVKNDIIHNILTNAKAEEILPDGRVMTHGTAGGYPAALIFSVDLSAAAKAKVGCSTGYKLANTSAAAMIYWHHEDFDILMACSLPPIQMASIQEVLELHRGLKYQELLEAVRLVPAEDAEESVP